MRTRDFNARIKSNRGSAALETIKSGRYSDKIFFKHMFELEFRGRNSKAGLPIVASQTDKLCSTDAYDSGYVRRGIKKRFFKYK